MVPAYRAADDRGRKAKTVKRRFDLLHLVILLGHAVNLTLPARKLARGEAVTLITDSTGMKFGRARAWYKEKYGQHASRTPWSKVHLSIDPDMNVHAVQVTDTDVSDSEALDALVSVDMPVDRVIADGAYYSIERTQAWVDSGVLPVIPPPAHAVIHDESQTRWHDRIVGYINEKGSVYAFHKKYGYGLRSLIERADLAHQALHRASGC
jgi:hypothetical protein